MKKEIKFDIKPMSLEKQKQIHDIARTAVSDAWTKVKSTTISIPLSIAVAMDKK